MRKLHVALAIITVALTACSGGFSPISNLAKPQSKAAFGSLSLDIPKGYCLDSKYSDLGQELLFALLHSCNAAASKGFYTLSVRPLSNRQFGALDDIKTILADPSGQQVLADLIVEQKTIGDIHFVRTLHTGQPVIPLTERDFWRSFFIRKGHLYTVTFLPSEGSDLSSSQRMQMVQAYSADLKR